MSPPPALPAALYKGAVNTWECDQNGHLNVRFQAERAFTGLAHLAVALDMGRAFAADACATLAPVDLHVRFLREAHPISPLEMHGGIVEFGEQDAVACLDMRHADGTPATAFTMRVAHVVPRTLRRFPWSTRTRAAAQQLMCKLPDHAKPRAIDMTKAPGEATLARAKAIGAKRVGGHLVMPDQCDAFGHLRGEHIVGRASDSVPHVFAEWRKLTEAAGAPPTLSGAVVEARVVYRRWPRAGDLIEVHSGIAEATPKLRRIVHWFLDPVSGAAWASMEVVAIAFDLTTRKFAELPQALVDAGQAAVNAKMSI